MMPMSAAGAAAPVTLPAARPARESYVLLAQGCSGAGTRWNAVPVDILEPERRSANIVGQRWNANTKAFRQISSYSLG